jgi:hypothetical protein
MRRYPTRGVSWLLPVKGGEIPPSLSDIMVNESDEELEGWGLWFAR